MCGVPQKRGYMAVIIKEKEYELPEDGQYLAVVADVVDLGVVATQFGPKEKVQIVYVLDAVNSKGENFRISQFFNKSLHDKASLRKALKAILRRDVSGTFDMDDIIGVTAGIVTEQNESDGKTYANVQAIIPCPKGQKMEIPEDFQRQVEKDGTGTTENPAQKKQEKKQAPRPQPTLKQKEQSSDKSNEQVSEISDSDIPF